MLMFKKTSKQKKRRKQAIKKEKEGVEKWII